MACTTQKESYTQEQLYEMTSSGVVLIQNTYYYKIILSDNRFYSTSYIFSKLENESLKGLSKTTRDNYNEVNDSLKNIIFGTGFFISPRGTIVTNSHVINPTPNKQTIYQSLLKYLREEVDKCNQRLNLEYHDLEIFEKEIKYNKNLNSKGYEMMIDGIQNCNRTIKLYTQYKENLLKEMTLNNYEIELCSEIKIAYNGNPINSNYDLIDCFVIKDIPSYDLGIIQIADGKGFWNVCKIEETPKWSYEQENKGDWNVVNNAGNISRFNIPEDKYIFNPYNENNKETNNNRETKLYMIGFNQGPILALTNDGIKAQITQGYISQNTDDTKMMYSIPALQGSSGSPVINQYGELVAINFAGINGVQGFNYGIKVEKLREVINDKSVNDKMKVYKPSNNQAATDSINEIVTAKQ